MSVPGLNDVTVGGDQRSAYIRTNCGWFLDILTKCLGGNVTVTGCPVDYVIVV